MSQTVSFKPISGLKKMMFLSRFFKRDSDHLKYLIKFMRKPLISGKPFILFQVQTSDPVISFLDPFIQMFQHIKNLPDCFLRDHIV